MFCEEDEAWDSMPAWMKAYGERNFLYKYNPNHDERGRFSSSSTHAGKSGMDVDKAVKHLNANAKDKSQKACASYVRQAIQAGGVKLHVPYPANARDYGEYLKQYRFTMVSKDNYIPKKGI